GHADHFGDALAIASRLRPAWPCIHEMSLWLGRRLPGGNDAVIGFNKGGTVEVAGLRVTMTTADHSSGDWNAAGETTLYLGEPAGFVIELESGYRVYHAGDTRAFGDMALIRDLYRPDLALLPIGGHFTMGPVEAALAVELLGVKDVVPMHYGTFPLLAGTPAELVAALAARGLGDVSVHAPAPGASIGG
ncbi:MAG: metal-dependent hydrolase, partial [Candidatus Limnocylindrales bacterium]